MTIRRVVGAANSLQLSEDEYKTMQAAKMEFLAVLDADITNIVEVTDLSREDAKCLLDLALKLLVKLQEFIDSARKREGDTWSLKPDDLSAFLDNA